MRILAIVFFSITAVLSAVLIPNGYSLLQLLGLSASRALVLMIALAFWVGAGHLDSWGPNRFLLVLFTYLCAAGMVVGCFFIQVMRDDILPAPIPVVYRVALALFPACLMIGVFLPSRKLFIATAVVCLIGGIVAASSADYLNKIYKENTPIAKENRALDAIAARRLSELDKVPETAGLEPLLEFVNPSDSYKVSQAAQARIEKTPDWVAQLSKMLDDGQRLNALYILTRRMDLLTDPLLDRCWIAAGTIAQEQSKHDAPRAEMLERSANSLGEKPSRERHLKEMIEVRAYVLSANPGANTALLDVWILLAQLHGIPDSAGIEPLLDFTGKTGDVMREARARVDKAPDSTAKLVKLLDSAHRLDAIALLGGRAGPLSGDELEQTWSAAALTAKEMAAAIAQHQPPKGARVGELVYAASALWPKLGPVQPPRLAELSTMRDVLKAAGDTWDQGALDWANGLLATH